VTNPTPDDRPANDEAEPLNVAPRRRAVSVQEGGLEAGPREKRTGCLLLGATLGIVVGLGFAFYGLKPILKHFYGEKTVAVGQAYTGDAKNIRVTYNGVAPDPALGGFAHADPSSYYVTLAITTDKTWSPKVSDFSVQFAGVGNWPQAVEAPGAAAADTLAFELGKPRILELRFPRPTDKPGAVATYFHISAPRVRIALPQP
jgi:hypothetical protein